MIKCNNEIYSTAVQFFTISESSMDAPDGIDTAFTDSIIFALKTNFAFSIELFIKSLSAISYKEEVAETAGVSINRVFSKSSLTGHKLLELYEKLPLAIQNDLSQQFIEGRYNQYSDTLKNVLADIDDVFVSNRYPFEYEHSSFSQLDVLFNISSFFKEALTPADDIDQEQFYLYE